MLKIDPFKVKNILDIHWKWFEKRTDDKEIEITFSNDKTWKMPCWFFLKKYFDFDKDDVEKLVKANYDELEDYIKPSNSIYKKYQKGLNSWGSSKKDSARDKLLEAFGYNNFINGNFNDEIEWWAYEFTRKLNVDVCPYCGRQYIYTIGENDEKYGRPQIDHYFPEADYPYLSCSLYNFIPSCPACNHQKKDKYNVKKEDECIKWVPYPYKDCFDEIVDGKKITHVKFKTSYKIVKDKLKEQENLGYRVKLKDVDGMLGEKLENAKKAFHLEDLYEMHTIELEDLFCRYRNYSHPKLDEIFKMIVNVDENIMKCPPTEREIMMKKMVTTYIKRMKNVILGFPLGIGDKQYPLRKFKEEVVEQLNRKRDDMLEEEKRMRLAAES